MAASASETLHTIMRCVFKVRLRHLHHISVCQRELFLAGRVLHDSNYEASLAVLGERCLGVLGQGRATLRPQEVSHCSHNTNQPHSLENKNSLHIIQHAYLC